MLSSEGLKRKKKNCNNIIVTLVRSVTKALYDYRGLTSSLRSIWLAESICASELKTARAEPDIRSWLSILLVC